MNYEHSSNIPYVIAFPSWKAIRTSEISSLFGFKICITRQDKKCTSNAFRVTYVKEVFSGDNHSNPLISREDALCMVTVAGTVTGSSWQNTKPQLLVQYQEYDCDCGQSDRIYAKMTIEFYRMTEKTIKESQFFVDGLGIGSIEEILPSDIKERDILTHNTNFKARSSHLPEWM